MVIIKDQRKKVELLSSILFANIFSGKSHKDDYEGEANEIIELIEGKTNVVEVSGIIAEYYISTALNDHFSDFENIAPVIAKEYLLKLAKLSK
jgi:hypothetical protein